MGLDRHLNSVRRRAPGLVVCLAAFVSLPVLTTAGQSSAGGQPPKGRALAIEDFYRLKTVGSPQLSPNGKWVAYVITTRVEATNGETGEAWLVPSDASRPAARVSPDGANASAVRW